MICRSRTALKNLMKRFEVVLAINSCGFMFFYLSWCDASGENDFVALSLVVSMHYFIFYFFFFSFNFFPGCSPATCRCSRKASIVVIECGQGTSIHHELCEYWNKLTPGQHLHVWMKPRWRELTFSNHKCRERF